MINKTAMICFWILSRIVIDSWPSFFYNNPVEYFNFPRLHTAFFIVYFLLNINLITIKKNRQLVFLMCLSPLAILVSGIYNGIEIYKFQILIYWIYFFAAMLFFLRFGKRIDFIFIMKCLAMSFLFVVFMQMYYVFVEGMAVHHNLLRTAGGFDHVTKTSEYAFFALLASMMLYFAERKGMWLFFLLAALVSLGLSGYRTMWLATLVFLLPSQFLGTTRRKVRLGILVSCFLVFVFLYWDFVFLVYNDLFLVVNNVKEVFDFNNINYDSLMSGRVFIWKYLIYKVGQLGPIGFLFGMGPLASTDILGLYAHNEFISSYSETGLLGVAAYSFFCAYLFWICFKNKNIYLFSLVVSFVVYSFGTMPMRHVVYLFFFCFYFTFFYLKLHREKGFGDFSLKSVPDLRL